MLDCARQTAVAAFDEHGEELERDLRERLAKLSDSADELLDGWMRINGERARIARVLAIEDSYGVSAQDA